MCHPRKNPKNTVKIQNKDISNNFMDCSFTFMKGLGPQLGKSETSACFDCINFRQIEETLKGLLLDNFISCLTKLQNIERSPGKHFVQKAENSIMF